MLALRRGFARYTPGGGAPEIVASPEQDPDVRFNDGKCDPAGRFWAGGMERDAKPVRASLWRLDPDGSAHRMIPGVTISNGIAWSLDSRIMYYIDTPTRELAAFSFDLATGSIADRRVAARFPEELGHPDGMTIDAEGMLWVAMWGGGCVTRWDPGAGRMLARIEVAASQASSCAFGGPALEDLYVTSARGKLSPSALASEPHAGGIFRARPGLRGVPSLAFAG